MKTKKNFLSMAALALVGAVMTGCSNKDDAIVEPQQPGNNVVTLKTTVSMDAGGTTRALDGSGHKTFDVGETMALIYKNTRGETVKAVSAPLEARDIESGSKWATFTFTLENPKKSENVTYIYPAAMAKSDGTVNYDALATQDGKLATLSSNLDLATYDGAWSGESLPANVTLVNQLAILKLQLKTYGANNTYDFNSVTIKDGALTYSINGAGGYGFGQSEIYVAIEPTSVALELTANHVSAGGYEKTVTSRTYEAGKIYALALNMVQQGSSSGDNTVTWDFSQLSGYPGIPYENGGVTLSGEAFLDFEDNMLGCSGECTFTAPEGKKFTSIVVTASEWFEFYGTGWSGSTWSDSDGQTTINFSGGAGGISTIVFTLADVD